MTVMSTFLLTLTVIAIVMVAMAVGLFFKRPCLRGSCGGPDTVGPDGELISCATCPNRKPKPGT